MCLRTLSPTHSSALFRMLHAEADNLCLTGGTIQFRPTSCRILRLLRHAFNLPWTKLQVTDILFSYRLYAEISRTSYVTISRFLNNRIQYGSHLQSPEGWRIQWKDEVSLTAHMNVILLLLRPSDPRGGGTVCEFCSYYLL